MMDNRQTRQINEAARTFAEAVQESLQIASQRSEEARERTNRLTRSFFESVASELRPRPKVTGPPRSGWWNSPENSKRRSGR